MSKNTRRLLSPYVALLFIITIVYLISVSMGGNTHNLSYSEFKQNLTKSKVKTVEISSVKEESVYSITGTLKGYERGETYVVKAPLSDDTLNTINEYQAKNKFKVEINSDPASSLLVKILNWLPYILIAGFALFLLNKQ